MSKKLILILLICYVFFGLVRQLNHTSAKSTLANKLNMAKINNKQIESISVSENKFIHDEVKQPKDAVDIQVDHVISDEQMKNNSVSDVNYLDKNEVQEDEIIQAKAAISHAFSRNFTLHYVNAIAFIAAGKHSTNAQMKKLFTPDAVNDVNENTDISNRQNQSDNQNDTSMTTDKVHCPSVETIQ